MSADDVIVADGLTKSYGPMRGVVELSFAVHAGEVFGFLGPNGAGKSTTIRTMLDFIRPTSGRMMGARPLSPLRWYLEPDPLTTGVHAANILVLVGVTAACVGIAIWSFARRDVSA